VPASAPGCGSPQRQVVTRGVGRFTGAEAGCGAAGAEARTGSAEARTTAGRGDCSVAGFPAWCFDGSAEAEPPTISKAPIAIPQPRMAFSVTCAKFRKTSFLYGLAKWLRPLT
jgi:hypothetical protein